MKRLVGLCGIVLLVTGVTTPATAGSGCHGPFTDERTTTVMLEMLCFSPTVARIQPGDTVTFKNADQMLHAVGGVGDTFGGHAEVKKGESLSFAFEEEGVFPYMCIYHPSMGGAIVVGDGQGELAVSSLPNIAPVEQPPAESTEAAAAYQATSTSKRSAERGWLVVGAGIAIGLVLLLLAALPRRRSVPQL